MDGLRQKNLLNAVPAIPAFCASEVPWFCQFTQLLPWFAAAFYVAKKSSKMLSSERSSCVGPIVVKTVGDYKQTAMDLT